jgi:SAM-dependent methyltransferase
MQQTPVHEVHNPDLLRFMPPDLRRIVEVGCSSGALAREYKKLNPGCYYTGIEIAPEFAELARRHCDSVHVLDIEDASEAYLRESLGADGWIFGDALEHLRDPWSLLERIRRIVPSTGCVVACIPNAQHWSVQARLSAGLFRYEPSGLLDRTHLRWFTRITIVEMFHGAGFKIVAGVPRILNEPQRETVLPAIRTMASSLGIDPEQAVTDALALQYVVRAVPV